MQKIILSSIATLAAIAIASAANGGASGSSDAYTSATQTVEAKQPYTRMTIEEPNYNFGDNMRRSKDLHHSFHFTNTGGHPLIFLRATTSCSCIKVDYPPHPVAAGESGTIEVTYEIRKRESGVFSKVIELYTNAQDAAQILTISGNSTDK